MNLCIFILLITTCYSICEAGVTEIPSTTEDEAVVEAVSDDTWMPSNIFEIKTNNMVPQKEQELEVEKDIAVTEETWNADSNPIFKALRDFIFQASDNLGEDEDHNEDPTEEIVKIIEKGLIEATTMFLNPSDEQLSTTSEDPHSDSISVLKIENDSQESLLDRIGLNIMNFASSPKSQFLSITNTTTACSTCYNTLETCVQQCFTQHNCNDVQRQARVCPPPTSRMCNIFTQWGPVDECKVNEDCKSPLLCCSDGCIHKCTPGVWRN